MGKKAKKTDGDTENGRRQKMDEKMTATQKMDETKIERDIYIYIKALR